jgi:predicted nuclease of predicted toxin-antitoxin system
MKFLVDAQLPRRLAIRLRECGQDATHTLDLPAGNRTSDGDVTDTADLEGRVVVTRDADFVNSFMVSHRPRKLLLVSTGNITNAELEALWFPNLSAIVSALEAHDFVELTRTAIIVH